MFLEVFDCLGVFFGEGLCWPYQILGKKYGEKVDVRKVICVKFTLPGIQIQVFQGKLENVNHIQTVWILPHVPLYSQKETSGVYP